MTPPRRASSLLTHRFLRSSAGALPLVALLVACGGGVAKPAAAPSPASSASTAATASSSGPLAAVVIVSDDDLGGTPKEVFDRASIEFQAGNQRKARILFDRVVVAEKARGLPLTQLGRDAEYNAALCSEGLEEIRDARDRYRRAAEDGKGTTDSTDALMRRARLDIEIEDDDDLALTTPLVVARPDLPPGDKAEVQALDATVFAHKGDLVSAQKGLDAAEKTLAGVAVPAPQNASAVPYALGEILRARSLAVKLQPVGNDFGQKLEARCQFLQDAQEAYIDAMKPGDVRWTIRAGVRIASMYVALHDELVAVPAPPAFSKTEDDKTLFRAAMRYRYRVLVEKGLDLLERVLRLDGKAGVKSPWIERARGVRVRLEKELADEKAALAKLPYTEKDIADQLDKIAKKNAGKKTP
jgi:tetratricopeptide (TPR) repeat protein